MAACSSAPAEVQAVQDVAEAMGGVEAVLGATSLSIDGSGTGSVVGQGLTPDDASLGGDGTYQSQFDLASHRMRTEVTTGAFGFPMTTVSSLDGDIAFNAGGFNPAPPARIGGRLPRLGRRPRGRGRGVDGRHPREQRGVLPGHDRPVAQPVARSAADESGGTEP